MTLEEVIAKSGQEYIQNQIKEGTRIEYIAKAIRKYYSEQEPCPRCKENEI